MYDAEADKELSAGPTVSESIQYLEKVLTRHMIWSPDCQLLLVYVQRAGSRVEGCLELLDVAGDCMLARSETLCGMDEWHTHVVAAWHPSSAAIILNYDMQLQQPSSFQEAGIIIGNLPAPLHPFRHSPGFSPDGQHVLTVWGEDGDTEFHERYTVLSSNFDGHKVHLAAVDISPFDPRPRGSQYWSERDDPTLQWLPGGTGLLVKMPFDSGWSSYVIHFAAGPETCTTLAHVFEGDSLSSPTGRHVVDASSAWLGRRNMHLDIIDMKTGIQRWSSATSRPSRGHASQLGSPSALLASNESLELGSAVNAMAGFPLALVLCAVSSSTHKWYSHVSMCTVLLSQQDSLRST